MFKIVCVMMLSAVALTACLEEGKRPGDMDAQPRYEAPTYEERVQCEKLARKEDRSSSYCWSNVKPEGATR